MLLAAGFDFTSCFCFVVLLFNIYLASLGNGSVFFIFVGDFKFLLNHLEEIWLQKGRLYIFTVNTLIKRTQNR